MYVKNNLQLRKNILAAAITTTLGVAASMPGLAIADIYTWGTLNGPASLTTTCASSPNAAKILFTMLDPTGAALSNSSITGKGANTFQTPTCGTLTYNTKTQSGTAEIGAFDFFGNNPTQPATAKQITLNKVPAGLNGGNNNLILANMLFDYNGTVGIPVSISYDAQGLLNEMDGTPTTFTLNADGSIKASSALTATGAVPASDGTYVGGSSPGTVKGFTGVSGYLQLGPIPLATTDLGTTNVISCTTGNCLGINPSANINASSAVPDTTPNPNRFDFATGVQKNGIGGYPMQAGPFTGFNANFDFTSMTLVSFTDTTPPVVSLNGANPLTVAQGTTYTEPGATCTDAPPLNTSLTAVVVIGGSVNTATIGAYNITYNCTDASSNNATPQTRIVNVVAAGTPTLTLTGTTPITHECAIPYTDAGATASDLIGSLTSSIIATPNNGTVLNQGTINIGTLGSQTIKYDVKSSGGISAPTVTRTVNVVDTTKPGITLSIGNPDKVVSSTLQNPKTYNIPTATATDSCDPSFPITISVPTGSVNMVVPDSGAATRTYNLGYSATDASSNQRFTSLSVEVTRSQPVIKLVGGGVILNIGKPYTEQGMDITDAQDGNLTTITASGSGNGVGAGNGLLTYTVDASNVDTSKQGNYKVYYNVTDSNGNFATQVVRAVQVGLFATGSNFTMLDSKGNVFGGTNDVTFDWDQTTNNDQSNYKNDLNFNMKIASQKPQPFFGFTWVAHDIRVFGPGTYSFDTGCTVAEIRATGCPAGSAANSGPAITMTVKPGQVGAHILFDWNGSNNIDVVNVWDRNGVWNMHGSTNNVNKLWAGQAGKNPDPTTTWKLVSASTGHSIKGTLINGTPMVDGPFQAFYANFNAGPAGTVAAPPPYVGTAPVTKISNSGFAGKSGLASLSFFGLFAALATLFGLRRLGKKDKR